jgi:hypothetical protein
MCFCLGESRRLEIPRASREKLITRTVSSESLTISLREDALRVSCAIDGGAADCFLAAIRLLCDA